MQPNRTTDWGIARLVESASETGVADAFRGKRDVTRFAEGVRLEVTTEEGKATDTWAVTMRNVSERGFSFWSRRELAPTTAILVREFSSDRPKPWLPAHVAHTTQSLKGFLIGASFDVDSDAAVAADQDRKAEKPLPDVRPRGSHLPTKALNQP